uniref:Uncharacterized protein n=1 Tax=Parascaris univalens TaxID=6257 RepID=A0A915B5C6_PARUN
MPHQLDAHQQLYKVMATKTSILHKQPSANSSRRVSSPRN